VNEVNKATQSKQLHHCFSEPSQEHGGQPAGGFVKASELVKTEPTRDSSEHVSQLKRDKPEEPVVPLFVPASKLASAVDGRRPQHTSPVKKQAKPAAADTPKITSFFSK